MSEVQPVSLTEWSPPGGSPAKWVNTNVVLKKVLQNLAPQERSKIILRCDDLPLAEGDEAFFVDLFRGLLQMILQKKEEVPTLFLHISCEAVLPSTGSNSGTELFTIQFNTNIIPCAAWFEKNKNWLNELSAQVAQNKGSLALNQFKASGCIFSVSLPGKAV